MNSEPLISYYQEDPSTLLELLVELRISNARDIKRYIDDKTRSID